MANEEDTELRDLVTQALENNGLLGKIQAQLRAGVFLALEETDKKNRKVHHNKRLQQFLSTKEGSLAAGIVQEFLEFFQLDYTSAVFEPESGLSGGYAGRSSLEKQVDCDVSDELPLLAAILKQGGTGHNVHLNGAAPQISSHDSEPINDTLDFLTKREPVDNMVNKCQFGPTSPPVQYKDKHIHSSKDWDAEYDELHDKIDTMDLSNKSGDGYDDDFEKVVSVSSIASAPSESKQDTSVTEEISGLEDINITSDKPTDGLDESAFTSDHTISIDSVGDIDYIEDITF